MAGATAVAPFSTSKPREPAIAWLTFKIDLFFLGAWSELQQVTTF